MNIRCAPMNSLSPTFSFILSLSGGSPLLQRSNLGSNGISPLATSQQKASSTFKDTEQPMADDEENPFEYGLGTQVMLSSMQTPARELLVDQARRLLNEEEVEELTEVLDNVRASRILIT